MKRIDIYNRKDLEQLKDLSGNDSIFLKIHKEMNPNKIYAISLKNFSGAITIDFELEKMVYKIYGENKKNLLYFFEDFEHVNLFVNQRDIHFLYYENQKEYEVKEESELQKILTRKNLKKPIIHLKKDMVFKILESSTPCIIDGENHHLFMKKSLFEKLPFSYQNTNIILVDRILYVYRKEDLIRLESLTNETVVVVFKNSIQEEEFYAISLKNFTGHLYVLGNQFSIRDCKIKSMTKSLGLFSVIHPYGSLEIQDLNLIHNIYMGENAIFLGGILASRKHFEQKYHSPSGFISIQNCCLKENLFYATHPLYVSSYVGYIKDNMEVIDTYAKNYINIESKSTLEEMDSQSILYSEFSNEKGIQQVENYVLTKSLRKL